MKTAVAKLTSESPYSQSRHYSSDAVPKLNKEGADAYERRTWRHRMHVTKDGYVEIPGTAFANALKESAKRLKLQVPGKGRVEYTKYFEAGVMVIDGVKLAVKAADVKAEELFVSSDGRRGGGKRVTKFFPRIESWSGDVTFYVLDDIITEEIFARVLVGAGMVVGIGRFRPQSCGFYGRFSVDSIAWSDDQEVAAQ